MAGSPRSIDPRWVFSPVVIMCVTWGLAYGVYIFAAANVDSLPVLKLLMGNNAVTFISSAYGYLWQAAGLGAFILGALSMSGGARRRPAEVALTPAGLDHAVTLAFRIHLAILFVTLLWLAISIQESGGIVPLFRQIETKVDVIREIFVSNKLFRGMRLAYTGLMGTSIFASAALGYHAVKRNLSRASILSSVFIILTSIILLGALPAVMSQRILLIYFVFGGYVSACMVARKLVWARYIPIGIMLLLFVWTYVVYFQYSKSINVGAVSLAWQSIVFYFVNDLYNAMAPVGADLQHTYGFFTFNFLTYYTFTDGFFLRLLDNALLRLMFLQGGGTFPIFTGPYVDFGPFGLLVAVVLGALCSVVYRAARHDGRYAIVYGMIAPGLILSTHSSYFSHQNFWFSFGIVVFLAWRSGQSPARARLPTRREGRRAGRTASMARRP